ncbi:MAG: hypothetical protein IPJ94_24340 [Chloroflexi bacterium]|nr:hypothetical protein [Chloroflexota bacterium]
MMKLIQPVSPKIARFGSTILISMVLAALLFIPALASGTWTTTSDMTYGRAEHRAVQLTDGRILAVGGRLFSTASYKAEIYDLASGTWSETGPMSFMHTNHSGHAAGRRPCAGGWLGRRFYSLDSATAEIYDPATNSWATTGFMTQGRAGHVAARLNDGRVLVAGDEWGSTTAEIYDPTTGTWTATGSLNTHHGRATGSLLPDGVSWWLVGIIWTSSRVNWLLTKLKSTIRPPVPGSTRAV